MLFFRSEEHIDTWCELWGMPRGATLTLDSCWRLALAWYGVPRTTPGWRRRSVEETEALFAELGLLSNFWKLR